MRRQEREITDIGEKINIIKKCKVCRVGLSDNNVPYIIPLNYGYTFDNGTLTLFFHSALEGKKLDILKNNNTACFEVDCDTALLESDTACDYGYAFKSVIGFGKIVMLENHDEKIFGLDIIMKHQTDKDTVFKYTQEQVQKVCVYTLLVESFTGKQRLLPKG